MRCTIIVIIHLYVSGKKDLLKFVAAYPDVLTEVCDAQIKLNLIKTKVMNERNKTRRLFQVRKQKYCS